MISKDFFQALDDLERERKISKESFVGALETALTSAYKKHIGEAKLASVKLNPEKNTIKIYSYKEVKDVVEDPDKEISLEDAREIKKSYKVGDIVEKEETPKDFGRIAAQTAKQVVMQKLRELERTRMIGEITEKEDEIVTGIVRRIEGKNVFVEIGNNGLEAVMTEQDQIKGEKYYINTKIKVYVKKIKEDEIKSPVVQVSRANVGFVRKLFELEVPEIQNGEVEIKSISREAGVRTKIAVFSANENIDAVGACVGNRGMRINTIVNELNGEKIDIILWSEDPLVYVARALSPGKVNSVSYVDEKTTRASVPDDKLSLAIGAGGINVRLAAKLVGIKIDVKAESSKEAKPVVNTFDELPTDLDDMFKD
ncbi:MAG: transcription termination factor NusA [Christensenellales bacterium]